MSALASAPVLVGVDGSEAGLRAVRHAAGAARQHGVPLHVVHVVPAPPAFLFGRPADETSFAEAAQRIIDVATLEASRVAPGLEVRAEVLHGPRVATMITCAAEAREVVLGAEPERRRQRIWTGAMCDGVLAHAPCPVTVVPLGWSPPTDPSRPRHVVAGFKSPDHSAQLLAAAFVVAAERGDDLVIVHGWKLPTAYDDVIGAQLTAQSVRQHVVDTIRPLIADLRKANPQVEVSIRVRHSRAAKALVEASRGADAVVMMRPDLPGGPYPGSTTRAVLRDSACPTLVLPGPVGVRPATRFVLEKHGAFQP